MILNINKTEFNMYSSRYIVSISITILAVHSTFTYIKFDLPFVIYTTKSIGKIYSHSSGNAMPNRNVITDPKRYTNKYPISSMIMTLAPGCCLLNLKNKNNVISSSGTNTVIYLSTNLT